MVRSGEKMVIRPLFLLLLILIPLVFFIARGRIKGFNRRRISLGIRIVMLLLFILALSGLRFENRDERRFTVFLLDSSLSLSDTAKENAAARIESLLKQFHGDDQSALVYFGEDVQVETSLQTGVRKVTGDSIPTRTATNIEQALYTALGLLPKEGNRNIVLLTDGNENRGTAETAATFAGTLEIPIHLFPLETRQAEEEVYIHDLITNKSVRQEQSHEMTIVLDSTVETGGTLFFLRDDEYLGESRVRIEKGRSTFTYTAVIEESGLHEYEVILEPDLDSLPENNRYTSLVRVEGPSKILLVTELTHSPVEAALEAQGRDVYTVKPGGIPGYLRKLIQYDAIIFDNIPAYALSMARMDLITDYVETTGGGFIMIGGDRSFGVGGYYETPIEQLLPLDMDVTSSLQIPSLSIVMVIDKSGSMADKIATGETKLDLAKEAILRAIDILNPFYHIGVVAFDVNFEWAIPMTEAGERQKIMKNLSRIHASGGTSLSPAMEEAFSKLKDIPSAIRHMIILSDGLSYSGDFEGITTAAAELGITVSTVAVGPDADKILMKDISRWGNGRAYFTQDMRNVPRIFASESFIVSRGHIVEETFFPIAVSNHEVLEKIGGNIPPLSGFVLTYPKATAKLILEASDGHPLLALWNYGAGRSAAFTSDLAGEWSEEWLNWGQFPLLLSQTLRWVERPSSPIQMEVQERTFAGKQQISIDLSDEEGNFLNQLNLRGILITPEGEKVVLPVEQTAPGNYTFEISSPGEGTTLITLVEQDGRIAPSTFGISIPYGDEYRPQKVNQLLLNRIAGMSGGRVFPLTDEGIEHYIASSTGSVKIPEEIWPALVLALIILFILDIALRQLPKGFFRIRKKQKEIISFEEATLQIEAGKKAETYRRRDLSYWFGRQVQHDKRRLHLSTKSKR